MYPAAEWKKNFAAHAAEIDDGHDFFDPQEADLGQFLTDEALQKHDTAIWYHASFFHEPDNEADGLKTGERKASPRILSGPDLVRVGY